MSLNFTVYGNPAPQGSKAYKGHRNGKPVLVESSKALKPWRDKVAKDAKDAATKAGWTPSPMVAVDLTFLMRRPVRHYNRAGQVRDDAPFFHSLRPDLDKLIRGVFDALTEAKIVNDDASIVTVIATKVYVPDGDRPGVQVVVATVPREFLPTVAGAA